MSDSVLTYTDLTAQQVRNRIVLRPSAMHRTFKCFHSAVLSVLIPPVELEEQQSDAALEGTYAHKLNEVCTEKGVKPESFRGKWIECPIGEGTEYLRVHPFRVTEEMIWGSSQFLKYLHKRARKLKGEIICERKMSTKVNGVTLEGTPDYTIIGPKAFEVSDYKFGRGPVLIQSFFGGYNKQIASYNYLTIEEHEAFERKIFNSIFQPRLDTPLTRFKLRDSSDFYEKWKRVFGFVGDSVKQSITSPAYSPSEYACHWCPAMVHCPALRQEMEIIGMRSVEEIKRLTPSQCVRVARLKGVVSEYFENLEKEMIARSALEGTQFPGFEIVTKGRNYRTYTDAKKAAKVLRRKLGKNAYKKELISPAQAEKLLTKAELSHLIKTVEGQKKDYLQPRKHPDAKQQFKPWMNQEDVDLLKSI